MTLNKQYISGIQEPPNRTVYLKIEAKSDEESSLKSSCETPPSAHEDVNPEVQACSSVEIVKSV